MTSLALAHLAFATLTGAALVPAADIFVNQNAAGCGTGTGTSASPVCSVTAAINLASPGDTIRIAPGVYVENITAPFDLELIGTNGAAATALDGVQGNSVVTIPVATTVVIDGLTIIRGSGDAGGGVSCAGALTLKNSVLRNNTARVGGAISAGLAMVTIENTTIRNNTAGIFDFHTSAGGGIFQQGGVLLISDSTIKDNACSANGGCLPQDCGSFSTLGGGIMARLADVTIVDSTISGNFATAIGWGPGGRGGGLWAEDCRVTLSNSTLSGNIAHHAGGVGLSMSQAGSTMSNMTITSNRAYGSQTSTYSPVPPKSGGLLVVGAGIPIQNTVIANNIGEDADGQLVSMGHNLIGTGALGITDGVNGDLAGSVVSPLNAMLGALQNNGGSTETHSPLPASRLIDAGDSTVFPALDQRGLARPSGFGSDIGAVEYETPFDHFCNGDGGDQMGCTDCPCGNNAAQGTIGGCLNSAQASAQLVASGDPSLTQQSNSNTDLRFAVNNVPSMAFCILVSGSAIAPGGQTNPCFGQDSGVQSASFDGLRCAIAGVLRHGGRSADMNGDVGVTNSPWGGEGAPNQGIAQLAGFVSGQVRHFQVVAREFPNLSCMTALNTTQSVRVNFVP